MSAISRRRILAFGGIVLAAPLARAQAPRKSVRSIAVLEYGTRAEAAQWIAHFLEGLRDMGYVEGSNLRVEYRFAGNDYRRVRRLAADLANAGVEAIYAPNPWEAQSAQSATSTIPIVFSGINDPVALGLVKSLARPGGNITGVSTASADLTAKRVELMREMFPSASRLGVVFDEDVARACQIELDDIGSAGKQLKVDVRRFPYLEKSDLAGIFEGSRRANVAALLVPTTIDARRVGDELVAQSSETRIPTVHAGAAAVEAGGLMSYGPEDGWAERRAGHYVGRILNGAKPADLPVERPTSYVLAVNLKTARALGLTVPQAILFRADRVVK
jgi:putative tryptophan/tyrosine transport system substrate-binding protein